MNIGEKVSLILETGFYKSRESTVNNSLHFPISPFLLITSHFFMFFRRTLLLPFLQIGLISCVNLVVKKRNFYTINLKSVVIRCLINL